jgi:SNF family Na+-dependent transporter
LIAFGALFMLLALTLGILIIYSGRCIKARRNWIFSLVIAGFMCLSVPLGTALGVFTFIVLLRDSVKRLYGLPTPPPYPAPPPY